MTIPDSISARLDRIQAQWRAGVDRIVGQQATVIDAQRRLIELLLAEIDGDKFVLGETYPDPSNTGCTGDLTPYDGPWPPRPGLFTDLSFGGMPDCDSTGVYSFVNCRFAPDYSTKTPRGVIDSNSNPDALIVAERCTFSPQFASNQVTGIYALNFTAERCLFEGLVDGFATYGTGHVLGCHFRHFAYVAADYQGDGVTHNDGGQIFGGTGSTVIGNSFDMRPGPLSDRPAPPESSTGGVGQALVLTPTKYKIEDLLIRQNWIDYGFRGIGGSAPNNGGGSVTITENRFGEHIASFPVQGYGSAVRPICVDERLNLIGLPATGLGVPDEANENVDHQGNPALVYRQVP